MAFFVNAIGMSAVTKMFASEATSKEPKPWHVFQGDVEYDIYHELGTAGSPARPHWRPGAAAGFEAVAELSAKATSLQRLIQLVALRIEANVKKIIQEKDIIDTGDLMRGVQSEEMR